MGVQGAKPPCRGLGNAVWGTVCRGTQIFLFPKMLVDYALGGAVVFTAVEHV